MMKLLYKTAFAFYLLVLIWLVLFKFSLDITWVFEKHSRVLNLIPFVDLAQSWRGMIENCIIFIPFGLLLGVNLKRATFWQKLAVIAMFSIAIEIIQFTFAIGVADITDVTMNTCGGLLGLMFYDVSHKRIDSKKLDPFIAVIISIVLIMICGILFTQRVRFQMRSHIEATSSQATTPTLPKDIQLAWPAVGQAAVGSVNDGLLAHSSTSEKQLPTASMAKVITALAVLKKQPLGLGQTGPSYTLTAEDVATYNTYAGNDGSVVPVHEGMVLTQYQILQAMLIPSANNMADTLVRKVFGSIEAYKSYAQDMLQHMGLNNTVIADASGFNPATVSTPSDLVTIGIAALKNPVIAEIVAQPQAQVSGVGIIKNTNELLGTDGVVGIKTGTTNQAGSCLLFAARYEAKDGREVTIVGVIMGDTNAVSLFSDSKKLLASTRQGFGLVETQPTNGATTPPLR